MRKPTFRLPSLPSPADAPDMPGLPSLSGKQRLLVLGAVLLGVLLLAACIATSLLVFGRDQGILGARTRTAATTTTGRAAQPTPKLSDPLTAASARKLAATAPGKIVWMGLPAGSQVRWISSIPTSQGVELGYLQGLQLAQYNPKNPTFTYLIQSANVTSSQASQLLAEAKKSSSTVAHIHGFYVILPPSGTPLNKLLLVSPSQRVSAEIDTYATLPTRGDLEALAAQMRILP